MLMYQYPYGNSQQLNLDWLLTAWRNFQKQVEDMIAPQWSDTESYVEHDLVIHDHVLYYCVVANATVHDFVPEEWQTISCADIFNGNM